MKSSGMKRGLAAGAIAALALSGVALAPASADTVGQNEPAFELYTQAFDASVGFDGSNNTVTLLAGVPNGLGASEVRFSYMKGGTQVEIAEIAPNNGVATIEWTPPVGAEGAAITDVRAEALDAAETVIAGPITNPVSNNTATGMGDNEATELSGALRSRVGRWLGPGDGHVVISGTTTVGEFDTFVQNVGPNGVGTEVSPSTANWTAPDGNGVSQYKVAVPIDATNDPSAGDDEIVIRSRVDGGILGDSDDANVYTMYTQQVDTATAPSAPGFPANIQLGGANDESRWNITVLDQEGQPINGVNVCEVASTADVIPCDGTGNGAPNNTETNVNGVAQVSMFESSIDNPTDRNPAPNVQSTYYIVDVDQDGFYVSGIDHRFELTQTGITPVATTMEITSSKGTVLDDDETTNLQWVVKDQNGQPIANKVVTVAWEIVCENAPAADQVIPFGPFVTLTGPAGQVGPVPVGDVGPTCEDGPYTITATGYANNDGDPDPTPGDAIADPLVLDFDTTSVVWDNGTTAQALNGTTTTQTGSLVQADGDVLGADRVINIAYSPSGNSRIAAAQTLPTQKVNDTTATSETNAQGKFSVAIEDPALPDGQELDNFLTAQAPGLESAGDQTDGTLEIDFLRSLTPDRVRIINPVTNDESDGLAPGLLGALQPGALGVGEVEVENADGVLLTDVDVDLTIDEGHFVDFFNTPFENVAIGAPLDFANDGQAFTVTTDDGGSAFFITNIERHEGFDDDGLVDDNMTASSGPASDVHDLTWSTNNTPINPRATDPLVVDLSADQESSILPKARAGNLLGNGQVVDYDVSTYDQFGNRTAQPTTVTDNTPIAGFFGGGQSEFDLNQPAISAFSNGAVDQTLEVELDGARKVTYQDNPGDSSFDPLNPLLFLNVDPIQVEQNTDAVNWYEVDYDASTFTLEQDGPNSVPVGSAVTEVLTATDQEGQPLENLVVDFLRGGPGNEDDDSCNEDILNNCLVTDINGEAFYDFVGGSMGTATITAVVYEPVVDGGARITTVGPDTVQFSQGGQVAIEAKLSGKNRKGKDVLKVNAPATADGAVVKLQKKTKNGWKQVGPAETLNASGDHTFKVADKNGSKPTTYRAKVSPTSDTKGDISNKVTLK